MGRGQAIKGAMTAIEEACRRIVSSNGKKLGVSRVKAYLENTGSVREIGGTQEVRDMAWKWVQMKEAQATTIAREHAAASRLTIIADSRIAELGALSSPDFDFRKLVRLCEEINKAYSEGCYFATAMLTRGLLDHVPPVFGFKTFSEVANNYAGGGKSFKETMQHLENAARKVADAHLHMPIRKSETLPTAQQVNCGQQLDMLLLLFNGGAGGRVSGARGTRASFGELVEHVSPV
jgi:hypothetical protein